MSANLYIYNNFKDFPIYDYQKKKANVYQHIQYMLNRTQSMFEYSGLPDTIPKRVLELYLQIHGFAGFYEYNDNLYVFFGGLGGIPDVYYMPTILTIANPALGISKTLKIDEECVVVPNDSMYMGMLPMFSKYGTALAENELSMDIATVNSRIISLVSASDDRTKVSADKYLKDVREGKAGIIAENAFFEDLKVQPYGNSQGTVSIKNLIEHEQYLKASWYNEIGLNSNYNMKRETLTDSENQMNSDALLPLIDNMLECRQIGLEKVNRMFGTNISVKFASAWEDNEIELELEHENMEEEIENSDEEKEVINNDDSEAE